VAEKDERKGTGTVVLVGGLSALGGGVLAHLLATKPAEASNAEAQWEYLIKCQENIISLLEQLLAASMAPAPGVTVNTKWEAQESVVLFDRAITIAATIDGDRMIDWSTGKRLVIKAESMLDQACTIQVVGNITRDYTLATDINGPLPCPAHGNISVGLAWDDWAPFIGIRITTAIAPATGILTVTAVSQE